MGKKGNPWVDFPMVIMASGIARGRALTTTATELRNMRPNTKFTRLAALVYHVPL